MKSKKNGRKPPSTIRRLLALLTLLCGLLASLGCGAGSTPRAAHAEAGPNHAALLRDGRAAEAQGDLTRAEQYYASALRLGVDDHAATRALVTVCIRASRLRSALGYGIAYLAEHPNDSGLRQLVGAMHLALGDLDLAERELRLSLRTREASPEAHYALAMVLQRAEGQQHEGRQHEGRQHEAREHLARYVALAPLGSHAARATHETQFESAGVRESGQVPEVVAPRDDPTGPALVPGNGHAAQ